MKPFLAVLALITLAVGPVRHYFTQDDAAYAVQTGLVMKSLPQGYLEMHPDIFASIIPQSVIGALAWGVSGKVEALNALTWIALITLVLLFRFRVKWSWPLIAGVFAVPYWIQYGSGYMYDIYGALLVLGFLLSWESRRHWATALIALLLPLETQFLILIPLWAVGKDVRFKNKQTIAVAIGLTAYALLSLFVPKSIGQLGHIEFLKTKPFWTALTFSTTLQVLLGFGWFLIPLSKSIKRWTPAGSVFALALVAIIAAFIHWSGQPTLAGGVMFFEYLPRWIASIAISLGVLGWVGTKEYWSKASWDARSLLILIGFVALFQGYRGVNDMRVALVWMPLLFWFASRRNNPAIWSKPKLGESPWFYVPALCISVLLNAYMVETAVQRWNWADDLQIRGVPANELSAGYANDHFRLEQACIRSAMASLEPLGVKHPDFMSQVYQWIPQVVQNGWIPRFRILPNQAFGRSLEKKRDGYRLMGVRDYKLFGLFSHQLALWELEPSKQPALPYCLR